METFLTLPKEMQEYIFSFCKVDDIINLSCCSKDFCMVTRCWLFYHLNVPFKDLETSKFENKKDYVKFARKIEFGRFNETFKFLNLEIMDEIMQLTENVEHVSFLGCSASWIMHDNALHMISDHSTLKQISLTDCKLSDYNSLTCIGNMYQLRKLVIDHCTFVKKESKNDLLWLTRLINLTSLSLLWFRYDEPDHGVIKRITSVMKLKELIIPGWMLIKEIHLSPLSNLMLLTKLDLSRNSSISDVTVNYICNLPLLKELNLYQSCITDNGVKKLMLMPSLRVLDINYCSLLSQESLESVGVSSIRELSVQYSGSAGIVHLKSAKSLKKSDISTGLYPENSITDDDLMYLKSLKFSCLQLKSVNLTNQGIERVCEESNMKVVVNSYRMKFVNCY